MRELDIKISEWRARMTAGGVKNADVLDELEAHLRDEIQRRLVVGDSEPQAFEYAAARIGNPQLLRKEFNKIGGVASLLVTIGVTLWAGLILMLGLFMTGTISAGRWGFLLYAHILTLTAGYWAAFLTGAFALYFLCLQWRGKLVPGEQRSLDRAIVRFNQLSFGLIIAAFVLGMVLVAQIPGVQLVGYARTREWAALVITLWQLMVWAMQRFSLGENSSRMLVCFCGNVVGALGWFGPIFWQANFSKHFLMNFWPLQLFVGFHLLVVALAFARRFEKAKSKELQYV